MLNFKSYFKNPLIEELIHITLDAAHMIKLCRNTLGNLKWLYTENLDEIKWSYFGNLVTIQEDVGLH